MGKMKEIYSAMKEMEWKGTPAEYLKWWLKNEAERIDKEKKK